MNPTNAYTINTGNIVDGNAAKYTSGCVLTCPTGTLGLLSYPTIPANAVPSGATVTLRHRESSTSSIGTLKVDVMNGNTVLCTQNQTATTANNPAVTSWTLPATCLDTAAEVNNAKVRFSASASGLFTSRDFWLDGMELSVNWSTAASRQLTVSGFSASVPTGASGLTAKLTTTQTASSGTNPQVVLNPNGVPGGAPCTFSPGTNVDVSACLNTPAKFTNLTATYTVTMAAGRTASIDGMKLDVGYTAVSRPNFPGACDPDAAGVQFVFAGESRMRFVDGTANLCAGPPAGTAGQAGYSAQRIAVYGNSALPTLQPSGATTAARVSPTRRTPSRWPSSRRISGRLSVGT